MKKPSFATGAELIVHLTKTSVALKRKIDEFNERYADVLKASESDGYKWHIEKNYNEFLSGIAALKKKIGTQTAEPVPAALEVSIELIDKAAMKVKTYCGKMAKYHKERAQGDYRYIQENLEEFTEYHEDFLQRRARVENCLAAGDGIGAAEELSRIDRYPGGAVLQVGSDDKFHPRDPKYQKIADQYNAIIAWQEQVRTTQITPEDWQRGVIALSTKNLLASKEKLLTLNAQLAGRLETEIVPGAKLDYKWYDSVQKLFHEFQNELSATHDHSRRIDSATTQLEKLSPTPEQGR